MPESKHESIPQQMRQTYDAIVLLMDAVCREHLNQEYADLCRRLAGALARKRPSPLARGKPEVWACGIVYTIGAVNFLSDRTQQPYLSVRELCRLFGVNQNTASGKSFLIKKMFKIDLMDPHWTLPSLIDVNPRVWTIQVNGFIIDLRYASRELQEEALRRGIIPYIPRVAGSLDKQ
ncbi:MAG: DUF6398 domain-containing protein [Chloroflexi bacterium]|nr:DUF6398 domain-containing protein [Chloroflexota bacterium]